MSLEVIYIVRHGFRSNWLVNPSTGDYSAAVKSPTGSPADPPLTAHGVDQAHELAAHLVGLHPPIERVYSSPYYRCLQTIEPFVKLQASQQRPDAPSKRHLIRGEAGISEWYGSADFEHPTFGSLEQLKSLFPDLDENYSSVLIPSRMGESIDQLHDRLATALDAIIDQCDQAGLRAVLLASHAAPIIALGRVLTGFMPEDIQTEDFRAFTCGLSIFRRRGHPVPSTNSPSTTADVQGNGSRLSGVAFAVHDPDASAAPNLPRSQPPDPTPQWRAGQGVRGGWDCVENSNCDFLSSGEERGWRFSGDESFLPTVTDGTDAGQALGVVVEGRGPNDQSFSNSQKHRL